MGFIFRDKSESEKEDDESIGSVYLCQLWYGTMWSGWEALGSRTRTSGEGKDDEQ